MKLTLQEIAHITNGQIAKGDPTQLITFIHCTWNSARKNSLLVITEKQTEAEHIIKKAVSKGCSAIIIPESHQMSRYDHINASFLVVKHGLRAFHDLARHYRSQFDFPFIGITGSNGKTTTKDLVAHLLNGIMPTFKTWKNMNNIYGVPISLFQIDHSYQAAVLEMGMDYYGQIDLMSSSVKPDIGIITNVNESHMKLFGSKENIAKAKSELLPNINPKGYAVLNGDDPYVTGFSHLYPGKKVFYGIHSDNLDIKASNIAFTDKGMTFDVTIPEYNLHLPDLFIPLYGVHNVCNSLPAVYIAYEKGLPADLIHRRLSTVKITGSRFEVLAGLHGSTIIHDAYNANPTSIKLAIETFEQIMHDKKKILVLGDVLELGKNSKALHQDVGAFVEQHKDTFAHLFTIGDYSEHIYDAFSGAKTHADSNEDLLEYLQPYLTPEYAILFKASRGMELDTVVDQIRVAEEDE
ncbi:UDP-N-acetylmuramoyl-tripeptide--D-alanyl-D-alanine ligase [Brevibacillus dissolubilis]|uniref:UDP-N-acetylmuramoyl-tripeptide--D-alanyl-D- alanine ligase n=1 Tax=Brevibacillus dissolubilis TaxID=1844116 RepID=UPI001117A683|nr:UDP-N-acetylmuramoyl-tripeptide--D-alanyl-D-alanine ligase [Brevibacillus dissolubilis]